MELSSSVIKQLAENILLAGAAFMALVLGIQRVYRIARNIDTLLERSDANEKHRAQLAADLARHIQEEDTSRAALRRDMAEILREVRPNGGSSIKDVVNQTNMRVAVLEQWKQDHTVK